MVRSILRYRYLYIYKVRTLKQHAILGKSLSVWKLSLELLFLDDKGNNSNRNQSFCFAVGMDRDMIGNHIYQIFPNYF